MRIYRDSFLLDVPKSLSNAELFMDDYLPFAMATIHESCTLVAAARVRCDQILIPTHRSYAFSRTYGEIAELKIIFPAGVTNEILMLTVKVMFKQGKMPLTPSFWNDLSNFFTSVVHAWYL